MGFGSIKKMDGKESRMKLLVVTPSYWPAQDMGGPVFSLHALNKALVRKGIDITVYTTDVRLKGKVTPDKEALLDGVKVTYFSFLGAFEFLNPTGWQFSMPMRKVLEKNIKDFDLVYILSVWNYPVVMAAAICKKFNKPYIISPRGLLYPETFGKKPVRKWLYYNFLAKKYVQNATAIHYTTDDEAQKCHDRLKLKSRALVVPNGVDLSEFENLPGREELIKRYPQLSGKKMLLFLGRLNWKKGLDILIKAYSRAAQERNDVHLLIAGGDDGYKNTAERLICDLKLEERVTFSGMLSGREKLSAYGGSDIFVLSSYSENFGMSVVEAMASGLAVVISDKVGIYNDVKDNNAGIIVKANAESVYEWVTKLLKDDSLRNKIAQNGKALAREYFDINKSADKMIAALAQILNGSSGKLPISAIIITLNEEKNIGTCLESIKSLVDEILLIDSGSTDKTLEIARKYTDNIYSHEFENFAKQRNWAQDNLPLKNEWVLHLDADERVSPELVGSIRKIFASKIEAAGILASRKTVFRGKFIRFGGHYPVYRNCLFKKSKGRSEERNYDQNYIVNGNLLKAQGDIINIINPELNEWRARHRRWAVLEAGEILENKEGAKRIDLRGNPIERRSWLRYNVYYKAPLFIRPFAYFFYRYILRLGFLDGVQGFVFHFWQGLWYRLLVDKEVSKLKRKK